jgi:hypothetical protein
MEAGICNVPAVCHETLAWLRPNTIIVATLTIQYLTHQLELVRCTQPAEIE